MFWGFGASRAFASTLNDVQCLVVVYFELDSSSPMDDFVDGRCGDAAAARSSISAFAYKTMPASATARPRTLDQTIGSPTTTKPKAKTSMVLS